MKSIEIDDDLYAFIASQTKHIGESASQILRRLLLPEDGAASNNSASNSPAATTVKTNEVKTTEVQPAVEKQNDEEDNAEKPVSSSSKVKPANGTTKRTASKAAPKAAVKKAPVKKTVTKAPAKKAVTPASSVDVAASHDKRDILDAVSKDALATFTKRVDQFLFVLSAAHKLNADNFSNVESIKGKNRTYFATSKEALLENGSSTNPKAIPDSPFWVVTNNNTAKKTNMLEQVLRNLGYQAEVVETVIARFSTEGK